MSGPIAAAPGAVTGEMRARIVDDPDLVLEDPAVMRALLDRVRAEGRRSADGKVVDLRTVAMDRLEERLDRLEAAHRTVIAAAYENLAGTQQIHRAALRLLEAGTLDEFAETLAADVAGTLRLRSVALLIEGEAAPQESGALRIVPHGTIAARRGGAPSRVGLRREAPRAHEPEAPGSEAALALDLGEGAPLALLVLSSDDPEHLAPGQGTELLEFLAGVVERALRRWRD